MKNIISKIPFYANFGGIVSTSTFRQSSVTFIGTAANGLLGAVFYIIIARFLGPSEYGLLSVAIVTLTLISDVGNLGTDTGLVNFVSRYYKDDINKAYKFLKLGLEIKFIVSVVILSLGIPLAPVIAESIFAKPELTTPLRIAFLGVFGLLSFSFITSSLQAFQRFWSWSILHISSNLTRLAVILILLSLGFVSMNSILAVYIGVPFLGFVLGLAIITPKFLSIRGEWGIAKEFFRYNKWVAAFTLMAAVGARLDTFISARLLNSYDVGLYSAANQMVTIIPMLVGALGTVIAPKMASMTSISDMVSYLKKTQIMVFGLTVLGVIAIPIVITLIPFLYGSQYLGVGPIFVVLFISMLIFLFSVPIHMSVFYYFSKPSLFFWTSTFHLLIVGLVGWNLISTYGPMGAAITVLIGQVFNFVVPLVWVLRKIQ